MFARIRNCLTGTDTSDVLLWYKSVYAKTMFYVLFCVCLQTNLFLRTKRKLKPINVEAHTAMYVRQQSANKIQYQSFRKSFRNRKASELNQLTNLLKCLLYCFHLLLWHF